MYSHNRLRSKSLLVGVLAGMLILLLALYILQPPGGGPSGQLDLILQKATVLGGMRANLLKAVEAEKSAVLSESDPAALALAGQARALAQAVETDRQEMHRLLGLDARPDETKLLAEFDAAWAEFQKIDQELLQLATDNTNLRATSLSRSEATRQIKQFEAAIAVSIRAAEGQPQAASTNLLAGRAVSSALHILILHAPHIDAAADADMDAMEAEMGSRASQVAQDLGQLQGLVGPAGQDGLRQAQAAFDDFMRTTAEVTRLSRMNNSIKSMELSLGRKRKVVALCDDALAALQSVVQARSFKATR
jgi:hypothetical protein